MNRSVATVTVAAALSVALTGHAAADPGTATSSPATPNAGSSSTAAGAPAYNTAEVVRASEAFLDTLSPEQRQRVTFAADDNLRRTGWSNLPSAGYPRPGLPFTDLDERQQQAALAVLDAALSDEGFREVQEIRASDDYLAQNAINSTPADVAYGSDYYSIAFYGTPSTTSPFTFQFGGHHVAHNLTYADGTVGVTPLFNGQEAPQDAQFQPLEDESSSVVAMLAALTDEQRAAAQITVPFVDLLLGPGTDGPFPTPVGQRVSDLDQEQQDTVTTSLRAWVGDVDERTAEALIADYVADYDETYIAWSGATTLDDDDAYIRIDGPRVWIEFSNQASFDLPDDGIHYHTLYRDELFDYGAR